MDPSSMPTWWDFDELARRNRAYREMEQKTLADHVCRIGLGKA